MPVNTHSIFDADAIPISRLFNSEGGNAGYRIPVYQRPYDWDRKNLKRLFEDVVAGLNWRNHDPNSLTFLGSIILLEDISEPSFDGVSLSVIDGQQRLTTISLLATQLIEFLDFHKSHIDGIIENKIILNWLTDELKFVMNKCHDLVFGQIKDDDMRHHPFPRIVREENDVRATAVRDSNYESPISSFIIDYSIAVLNGNRNITNKLLESSHYDVLKGKVEYIRELIINLTRIDEDSNFGISLPSLSSFEKKGFKDLFKKLPDDQTESNKILSGIQKENNTILSSLRLVSFTYFLMDKVVITSVKVKNEKYAFDIFDSLNTTGEPLTAIQTFKPQVIRFENQRSKKYLGSHSEMNYKNIEKYIDQPKTTEQKQYRSKELVIAFALYKTGSKISMKLDDQRRYLNGNFQKLDSVKQGKNTLKESFVAELAQVTAFFDCFWGGEKIISQLPQVENRNRILMCIQFLADMKMKMSISVLCRFYNLSTKNGNWKIFEDAVLAFTSYTILRRSATGRTDGIDTDIRNIMEHGIKGSEDATPLCLGLENDNPEVSVQNFKKYLKYYLDKKGVNEKEDWINKLINQPLYQSSPSLCKMILFLATHNSMLDGEELYKLRKVKQSSQKSLLDINSWKNTDFSSVEHIAPQKGQSNEWDLKVYSRPEIVHSIGNLTMLPVEENAALSNKSWANKKILFKAFASETIEEVKDQIEYAKKMGINYNSKTKALLTEKAIHLPFAANICNVSDWNYEVITERGKNLASLAWYEISSWLNL